MATRGYRLGVDFGTSNTVAVLAWPDGRAKPLLFDGSPLLPSAVYGQPGAPGRPAVDLLVGRDALHAARAAPASFEPHPKRRIDDGAVLLGAAEVPVVDLIAAVLGRVGAEARRVADAGLSAVVLTHPASWGPRRRALLSAAAETAGLPPVGLVPEPVAAATYLVEVAHARLPVGACAVIYDFGAGTFDATVVRRTAGGCEVLATRGLDDTGGLDIDAALIDHLGTVFRPRHGEAWRRLTEPVTAADRRAARQLWDDACTAKESLSRVGSTLLHLPLVDDDAPIGREQLEAIARPVVGRTIAATGAAIRDAGLTSADLAGVFLVGGASRLPLAATLLHRTLGLPAFVTEQPELIVAEGSLHARPEYARPEYAPPEPAVRPAEPDEASRPAVVPAPATPGHDAVGPTARRRTRLRLSVGALLVVLAVAATIIAVIAQPDGNGGGRGTPGPSASRLIAPPQRLGELSGAADLVNDLAFSPDGSVLATAGDGRRLRLWDVASRAQLRGALSGHTDAISAVAFSPAGHIVATAGLDRTVRLWDVPGHRQLGDALTGHTDTVFDLAFSPDGSTIATVSADGTMRLWDVAGRRQSGEPLDLGSSAGAVCFSPNGPTLVVGTFGTNAVQLWNPDTRQRLATLAGHAKPVESVACGPDGIVASSGFDGSIRLWSVERRSEVGRFDPAAPVNQVSFSRDGRLLAGAESGLPLRLWDVAGRREAASIPIRPYSYGAAAVAFSPAHDVFAFSTQDEVLLWAYVRSPG